MAVVFEQVAEEMERNLKGETANELAKLLRPLDYRARRVLGLFAKQDTIKSSDAANLLGVSIRQPRL